MRLSPSRFVLVCAFTAAAGVLTACGSDSAEDNAAAACDSYSELTSAMAKVTTLSATSTVDDVRAVREAVDEAYDDFADDLKDVASDRLDTLDEAYDAFDKTAEDMPGDTSIGQAVETLVAQATTIETAESGLAEELGCK